MGTNYYIEQKPPCECCGRGYEQEHIGKNSSGWPFALHVIPEAGINTPRDWQHRWEGRKIFDEYRAEIPPDEMWETIHKKEGWEPVTGEFS